MDEVAARVLEDTDQLRPTRAFSQPGGRMSLQSAYQVQAAVADLRLARGERLAGFKVGCTSNAIQSQFGLDQPVRGYVWQPECWPDRAAVDAGQFRCLGVEGELGVRVVDSSPPAVREWQVEWFPVIELHHYAWDGQPPSSAELVARNAIHAGIVAPSRRRRCRLDALPARALCTVRINGTTVGEASLSELPGGPQGTFEWLCAELRAKERAGGPRGSEDVLLLGQPGTVVITSSPAGLYRVAPGDLVQVRVADDQVSCSVVSQDKQARL